MVSINEEFAAKDEIIQDGEMIAFIPPVSGGMIRLDKKMRIHTDKMMLKRRYLNV